MEKELVIKNFKNVKYFNVYEMIYDNGYNSLFKLYLNEQLIRVSTRYLSSMPEDNRYFDMQLLDNKNGYISLKKRFDKNDPEIINDLYNNDIDINKFDNTSIVLAVFKYDELLNKLIRISKFFINGYMTRLNLLSCDNLFVVNVLEKTNVNKVIFQCKGNKFRKISDEFGIESLYYNYDGKSDIIDVATTDNKLRQLLQYNKEKNSFDVISDKYNSIDAKLLIVGKSDYFIASLIDDEKSNRRFKSIKRCVMKYDKKSNKSVQISKWFYDCHIDLSDIKNKKQYQVIYYLDNNKTEIYSVNIAICNNINI